MYLIINAVQTIETVFFLEQVLKPKLRYSLNWMIWMICIIIVYILGVVFSLSTDQQSYLRILSSAMIVIWLYRGKITERVFSFILMLAINIVAEFIGIGICQLVYEIPIEAIDINSENYIFYVMLLCTDLWFIGLLTVIIIWKRKELCIRGNFTQIGIMFVAVLIHFIAIFIYYTNESVLNNMHNHMMQLFFQLLLYIILVFNYFNALRTRKLMESQQTLKNLETEMEHNYSYYTLADEKFTEISKLRHDILNQIQTVQYILGTEKNEHEARQIMKRIEEQLAETKTVQFCQNPIINSVLTLKMNTVKASGIETDIVLNDCEALPFDNYDICSLFANLFDNAIEACQKLEDGEKRLITIRSGIKNDFFVLKITNSCKNTSQLKHEKKLVSDKGSKEHGYGTKIVESITKKYNGTFTIRFDDKTATTVVALKITSIKTI